MELLGELITPATAQHFHDAAGGLLLQVPAPLSLALCAPTVGPHCRPHPLLLQECAKCLADGMGEDVQQARTDN